MRAVLTGKEAKAIDTYSINTLGIPSLVLMERAAFSMVRRMKEVIGRKDRILCVCGAGNNGGDGVAIARMLYLEGYSAAIFMAGAPEKYTEETKKQIQIARNIGVPEYNELKLTHIRIVVDGLFGIGLSNTVREPYASMIEKINSWRRKDARRRVWSVDVPSGISSDTGQVLGTAVAADETVTFGYLKRGLLLYPGRDLAGKCFVEDIGFPKMSEEMNPPSGFSCEFKDFLSLPRRKNDSNKGTYGKILIVSGSKNMCGAAYFAGHAAYAAGAGLVRILTPEANRVILQSRLPQAMLSVWEEMTEERLAEVISWADALVVGPGVGTEDEMAVGIEKVLSLSKCPLVLDADGLNLLAQHNTWYPLIAGRTVITPHMGEMSRLTGKSIDVLKADRCREAQEFAKTHDVVCVLKDSSTVAGDGKKIYINTAGNHGMATGGSGDVLSGIIGALLGAGADLFPAAYMGVYLHSAAGDEAAEEYSARGMSAMELLGGIYKMLKKMEFENQGCDGIESE